MNCALSPGMRACCSTSVHFRWIQTLVSSTALRQPLCRDTCCSCSATPPQHAERKQKAWQGSASQPAHAGAHPRQSSEQQERHQKLHKGSWSQRLGDDIKAARSLQQLQQLLVDNHQRMDSVHVTSLCSTLVKSRAMLQELGTCSHQHQHQQSEQLQLFSAALTAAILHNILKMKPRHSSTLLWALGKMAAQSTGQGSTQQLSSVEPYSEWDASLDQQGGAVQQGSRGQGPQGSGVFAIPAGTLLQRLAATAEAASGRDIAQALYGIAQLKVPPPPSTLARLLAHMQRQLPSCLPQDLSMCIYALAVLGSEPSQDWMAAFFSSSRAKLESFSCQALSNTAWGLATLQQRPDAAWLSAFLRATQRCASLLSNQELTTVAWALSKLQLSPTASWLSMLQAEANARVATMNGQDLSLLLAAMSHFGCRPSKALLANLSGQMVAGTVQSASRVPADSLALTAAQPGASLIRDASEVRLALDSDTPQPGHVPRLSTGDVDVSLAAASATFQAHPSSTPEQQAQQQQQQQAQQQPGVQEEQHLQVQPRQADPAQGRSTLSPTAACGVLRQLAQMGVAPSQGACDTLLTNLNSSLPTMPATELVILIHALAQLHYRPDRRWISRFLRVLRLRLPSLSAEQLAGTLWSLARLGIRPDERWMSWALLECQRRLPHFNGQALANMAWALARLDYRPRRQWLAAFFSHTRQQLPGLRMQELAMMAEAVARAGFSPPQAWVENLQVELAHRAAGGRPCNTVLALPGAGGRCTVDGRAATPAEVYAVLRALARIEGRAHGRLLAPATAGLMGSEVLTAACMASLTVMRRQKRANST